MQRLQRRRRGGFARELDKGEAAALNDTHIDEAVEAAKELPQRFLERLGAAARALEAAHKRHLPHSSGR